MSEEKKVPWADSIDSAPRDGRWHQVPSTESEAMYVRYTDGECHILTKTGERIDCRVSIRILH